MRFWIVKNGEQTGPFELDQLKYMQVTPETMVWTNGMPDWAPASTIPALAEILISQPPHYTQPYEEEEIPERPKNWLPASITCGVLLCPPLAIPAIIFSIKALTLYNKGEYDEAYEASNKAGTWFSVLLILGSMLTIAQLCIMFS